MTHSTVVMTEQKNVGIAVVLAFLFGPLGMLYSTVTGAVVMFFCNLAALFLTLGVGLLITWPLGVVWAGVAASNHNTRTQAMAYQMGRGPSPW